MTLTAQDKDILMSNRLLRVAVHLSLFAAGLVSIISSVSHLLMGVQYIIPAIELIQAILVFALWIYAIKMQKYKEVFLLQLIVAFLCMAMVLIIGGENFITNLYWISFICPAAIIAGFKNTAKITYVLSLILIGLYFFIYPIKPGSQEVIFLVDALFFTVATGFMTLIIKNSQDETNIELNTYKNKIKNETERALEERINEVTSELRGTQKQLILSEKMVSLGILVSSVAHEINTPIASIKASSNNIVFILNEIVTNLRHNYGPMDERIVKRFIELISAKIANIDFILSSRDERAIAERILNKLQEFGVNASSDLCEMLAQLNIEDKLERYLPIFKHQSSDLILKQLSCMCDAISNSANIKTSVEMVSKIIFALKSFSYNAENDDYGYFDATESIETVLTIYQNKTRNSVKIVRQFEGSPKMYGVRNELQQVWINLIHNALHAMNYSGTLTISITSDKNAVKVDVEDTGCGIDKSIQRKIFEPFFTTKSMGEGSGLGLNIVKKIVEKHLGTIAFTSMEGKTIFTVLIPDSTYPIEKSDVEQ